MGEYGILVWNENRYFGSNNPQWLLDLESMILRDRNHPSIIIWRLCFILFLNILF